MPQMAPIMWLNMYYVMMLLFLGVVSGFYFFFSFKMSKLSMNETMVVKFDLNW